MAKLRVYELAKELKVDNKDLLRQLIDMGLDMRNHMSVISPEEAQVMRERLRAERSDVVEEKRVTTRVIRRRRKAMEEEEANAFEGEPVLEAAVEEPILEAAVEEPILEAVVEEPILEAVVEEAAKLPTPSVQEAKSTTSIKSTGDSALPLSQEREALQPLPGKFKLKEQRPVTISEEAPRTRRPAGDTPARIISRPSQPVAPMAEQRFVESRPLRPRPSHGPRPPRPGSSPGPSVVDMPPPEKLDERNRHRRKKGKKPQAIPDDEFLMRNASSKKKEILDKADLYDTRPVKLKRGRSASKRPKKTELTTPKAIKCRVKMGEAITVSELAKRMGVKSAELVSRLMQNGMMVTLNQALDVENATLVAAEFGFEVIDRVAFEEEGLLEQAADREEDLLIRPPVVTIMGHVDHGKTSLLDTIRRSNVVSGEAGGITQHIGAYNVHLSDGGQVIFVDTPGHEAFTQMRARGAQVTDVVVLVVAADDGVMQQTKEAISHSRAAGVPIVVAINKIDKPGADPERVRRELADQGLVSEAWGGDTIMVEVSAKTGQGVDTLLEMLQLQSEVLELRANPQKSARGHILEAYLDKGRGPVATVLVQDGTLKSGDAFVCGVHSGRVRALFNDLGQRVDEVGPSIPVEVQGFAGMPEAGDEFAVVEIDKLAKQIAEHRALKKREAELSAQTKMTLEDFFDQMKEGAVQKLKLIVKGDVHGSVQALVDALSNLGNEQVKVTVIQAGAGAITETDVMLASASNAVIIGFNVRPTSKVSEIAEAEHVDVRTYDVIYQILDDITAALTGMLTPVLHEEILGRAEVREIFSVPKIGTVAGCAVINGKVERNAQARLLREGVVVATTKISSLRRFKEDVKEVVQGYECGIGLDNYNDIKVGDEIEALVTREVAAEL